MSPEQRPVPLWIKITHQPKTMKQSTPLWKEMRSASEEARMAPPGSDYAAKIRAVRDWLVPEEAPCPDMAIEALLRDERQRLRALLTAEAERAEAGE